MALEYTISRPVILIAAIASLCSPAATTAQTEIHKCTDIDGGIVYSQLPCTPQESVEPEKTEPDEAAEGEPEKRDPPVIETTKKELKLDANRTECKKRYRDAIDVIDAEIGREYSPEKADQYKQRLLLLTRKLRQC